MAARADRGGSSHIDVPMNEHTASLTSFMNELSHHAMMSE